MRHGGKVVFITGAGRGIGAAIARQFAKEGADVALFDLSEPSAVAQEIQQIGRKALPITGDVADPAAVDQAVEQTVRELGRLDVVVANAVFSERGSFLSIPRELFVKTIDVTMWGALHAFQAGARAMIAQQQGGCMIAISSPHAVFPVPNAMPYNMAKAAVDHMARTAAAELFEHRIRVNIIHPGWIDTPGERKFFSEEQIRVQSQNLPWKRMGQPEEIAEAVSFLASAQAEYINGTTLTVDGGQKVAVAGRSAPVGDRQ